MKTLEGIILLDKPPHMTSARAITAVKYLLPRGIKIGHAGTLDPFATGLLIVLIGKATRQCERVMSWTKTYHATIKLGAVTKTDDPNSPEQPYIPPVDSFGNTIESAARAMDVIQPTLEEVQHCIAPLTGSIWQRPPQYSAVKIKGKRASDYARDGKTIELQPRLVQVYSFTVTEYRWPFVNAIIDCGRGTYVRSLAKDLGQSLRVGGYLTALRRTRIGTFTDASTVSLINLSSENIHQYIQPLTPSEAD